MKTIVVSAVNIRRGGTLRILRDCLSCLSAMSRQGDYRIVAVVHDKELAHFDGIEYIEIPWTVGSWARRLWCEYVTLHKLSHKLEPVDLWFSLHDTSPRVHARMQAAYFQTAFPFMKLKRNDFKFDYKIALFGLLTRFAYRINIHRNRYIVVQAEWLRRNFSRMFGIAPEKFIVAPPEETVPEYSTTAACGSLYRFAYICGPDCHKNIELLCESARILENRIGKDRFRVSLTLSGAENKYASWIKREWGGVGSIEFLGYLSREDVDRCYAAADCLVFPSRIETWGLPISEFRHSGKPMLLADLPYAYEAAAGSPAVAFIDIDNPENLAARMQELVEGHTDSLAQIDTTEPAPPSARTWRQLFEILLD